MVAAYYPRKEEIATMEDLNAASIAGFINRERIYKTLLDLIGIDSPSGQEDAIAHDLRWRLADLHEAGECDPAGNIIVHVPGRGAKWDGAAEGEQEWMLLCAHMDTAGDYTHVRPQLGEDGVLRSDGTTILGADDKAGIAVILEVLQVLHEHPELPHPGLDVVFTVGEETGLNGARSLQVARLNAYWGYVLDLEVPVGTIGYAAPWAHSMRIDVQGRTAHAGVAPEDGINAMSVFVEAAAQLPIGRVDEETVSNISSVSCDYPTNIVPARLQAEAMVRSLDAQKLQRLANRFTSVFKETADKYGAQVFIEDTEDYDGYALDAGARPYALAMQAMSALGIEPVPERSTGATDANIFNAAGLQVLGLSVGECNAHALNEQIAVDDLVQAAQVQLAICALAGA
jgi:tripeptide aminopeptidase